MELRDIEYKIDNQVALVSLTRPAALNAIRHRTIEELESVFEGLEDYDVRGVVITGSGQVFCSGLDPAEMFNAKTRSAFQGFLKILLRQPRICICAVNGSVIGAGIDLALACDMCITADRSTFSFSGSVGAQSASSNSVPNHSRRTPCDPSARWMATGEIFTARQALASKLVDYVVLPEHVLNFAMAEARTMIRYSPQSIRMAAPPEAPFGKPSPAAVIRL